MTLARFKHTKILGIQTVVPQKEICIYNEAQYYNNSVKKIDRMRKMVGFYKRRVVDDDTITPSDLAYDAAEKLLTKLNIDRKTIDALVFIVQQPDVVFPASAYFLHNKLNLSDDCIATDVNQGCVGWLYGLYIASNLIESGIHQRILLLNGDAISTSVDIKNRNVAPIFGDAGTATLIDYNEKEINSYYNIETKSYGFESIIKPFSGKRFKLNISKNINFELLEKLIKEKITMKSGNRASLFDLYIDGTSVFNFTIKEVPKNIKKILEFTNYTPKQIGALCLHQANKQIIQAVASSSGFDINDTKKVPYKAFENYGNNTMCSIPTTLALLDKSIKKDKLLCCAFGNGLVSISSVLNLDKTFIYDIENFKKPSYIMTQEEYIEYWKNKIRGDI